MFIKVKNDEKTNEMLVDTGMLDEEYNDIAGKIFKILSNKLSLTSTKLGCLIQHNHGMYRAHVATYGWWLPQGTYVPVDLTAISSYACKNKKRHS